MERQEKAAEELHHDAVDKQEPSGYSHVAKGAGSCCLAIFIITMQISLLNKLCHTCSAHTKYQRIKRSNERNEKRVVVLPDAGTKPNAVMIKLLHAVVAQVAVSALCGTKN